MLLLLVMPWFILNFVCLGMQLVFFKCLLPFHAFVHSQRFCDFCRTDKTVIAFLLAVVKRTRRGCSKHQGRKRWKHKWTTLMPAQHHDLWHQRRQVAMTFDISGDRQRWPATACCQSAASLPTPGHLHSHKGRGSTLGGFRTCRPVCSTSKSRRWDQKFSQSSSFDVRALVS